MKRARTLKAGAAIKKLLEGLPRERQIIILQTAIFDLEFDQEELAKAWWEKAGDDEPIDLGIETYEVVDL